MDMAGIHGLRSTEREGRIMIEMLNSSRNKSCSPVPGRSLHSTNKAATEGVHRSKFQDPSGKKNSNACVPNGLTGRSENDNHDPVLLLRAPTHKEGRQVF